VAKDQLSTYNSKGANIIRAIIGIFLAALLGGCVSEPSAGISLKDAHVVEGPVLLERSGHVYLRYRRALEQKGITLATLVYHKKTKAGVVYYFSVPISHPEWGNLVERPLAYDRTEELARNGKVFWLDPDGTMHPIPLEKNTQRF